MTKLEENQQNLNISFKIKIIKKKDLPAQDIVFSKGPGLYKQLRSDGNAKPVYNRGQFSLEMLEQVFQDLYDKKQKDEYRKKFSIRSKIFKQTYKFG